MASEFARKISERVFAGLLSKGVDRYEVEDAADTELQEVREVVKLVAHPKFDAEGDDIHYYVTKADIERARALMLKLGWLDHE